jgi:hypothetical protein
VKRGKDMKLKCDMLCATQKNDITFSQKSHDATGCCCIKRDLLTELQGNNIDA